MWCIFSFKAGAWVPSPSFHALLTKQSKTHILVSMCIIYYVEQSFIQRRGLGTPSFFPRSVDKTKQNTHLSEYVNNIICGTIFHSTKGPGHPNQRSVDKTKQNTHLNQYVYNLICGTIFHSTKGPGYPLLLSTLC